MQGGFADTGAAQPRGAYIAKVNDEGGQAHGHVRAPHKGWQRPAHLHEQVERGEHGDQPKLAVAVLAFGLHRHCCNGAAHLQRTRFALGIDTKLKAHKLAHRRRCGARAEGLDVGKELGAARIGRDEAIAFGRVPLGQSAGLSHVMFET